MIKIIKNGIISKKYKTIYRIVCTDCRCDFEFEEEDCKSVTAEKHLGGKRMGLINCPYCGCTTSRNLNECTSRQEEIID